MRWAANAIKNKIPEDKKLISFVRNISGEILKMKHIERKKCEK